jgi:LmbE family N-acetylglucosaminyl deacetylase
MLNLLFDARPAGARLRFLFLGAHSDDLEIGCGGTALKLVARYPDADFHWVVFSAEEQARQREAREGARRFLAGAAHPTVELESFRTSFFPYEGARIKERFEALKAGPTPDVVFTHCRHDLHQDHRVLCELTWNTFRSHLVLEYEIPKYDGDLGAPNVFVPLDEATVDTKIHHLMDVFGSQRSKHWFSPETFRGLMRLRGVESASQYAEAFHGRKLALSMAL